jgi:hypothetical protein
MCWYDLVIWKMRFYLTGMAILLLTSCEIINPAENVPSYIHIDSFTVTSDNETQGSSSSNIRDVWVTINGQDLGVHELPATLPVIASGNQSIILSGGIFINGISATRTPYPFYTHYETTLNLEKAKILTLNPTITYASFANFEQKEDFDHPSISFDTTASSDTTLQKVEDSNSLEGQYGYVYLDASHPRFECASNPEFLLPGGGVPVYVELNYKCNNEFVVGTIANNGANVYVNDIITIRASDVWKKLYVNLTPVASSISNADWKIFIRAIKSESLSTAQLYFDNIKVIH